MTNGMQRRGGRVALSVSLVGALLALAACGGGGSKEESGATTTTERRGSDASVLSPATTAPPANGMSQVATAVGDQVQVYADASEAQPTTALDSPNENGAPLVFLVEQTQGDWLQVLLPIRPNGSTGWIKASEVEVADNPYRVDIKLTEHRLVVSKGEEVVADEPIGVGTSSTPTPGGKYYIKELLQPPDPNGPYGHYAYGLSGFSNVLDEFNGGDGVIGIHGTNDPSTIGSDVSHGCIRLTNDAIDALVPVLPLGTPVHIEA
ncbi:MAG TPA: L,D-transpeptidase [Acidimicrobiales bacterium]|nr:L,D-transpeptidase [Acidimicrobiales bacterium]